MKILTKDGIYVQKNDIAYLTRLETAIPASIFMAVFSLKGCTIIDDTNRYEFVKFTSKEEIQFLKSLDWIIDYYKVKDLSYEELEKMFNEFAAKLNNLGTKYNAMSIEERAKNVDIANECENLQFMLYSIEDMGLLKLGRLDMPLPEGVEKPTIERQEQAQEDINITDAKSKGFQKIIKRIFKKKLD